MAGPALKTCGEAPGSLIADEDGMVFGPNFLRAAEILNVVCWLNAAGCRICKIV